MATISDVAKYFLTKVDMDAGDVITHLKLQKLCYYAQAWYLALEGKRLFDAHFEAWAHGPVNPDLWNEYRHYGWEPIDAPEGFDPEVLPEEEREFLDEIWDVYGRFSAKYLEALTHGETPWKEARGDLPDGARCNVPLSEETMKEYYRSLIEDDKEE